MPYLVKSWLTFNADDFQQLNEKFIKARRDYEALLESSMAQSAQAYARPGPAAYGYGATAPPQQGYPPQRFYTPGEYYNLENISSEV